MKAENSFIKATLHSRGELAGFQRRNQPVGCFRIGYYRVSLGWEELESIVGWSLMEASSSHLEDYFHRLGGRDFDPARFIPEQPFSVEGEGNYNADEL